MGVYSLGDHAASSRSTFDPRGLRDQVHFIYRNLRTSGVINPPRDLDAVSVILGIVFYYPVNGLPQEVAMEWELFDDKLRYIPGAATNAAGPLPYRPTPDDNVLLWQTFTEESDDAGAGGRGRASRSGEAVAAAGHASVRGRPGVAGFPSRRGSVGHWGHVHQRTNQYQARLTVEAVGDRWKITALDLLQEERTQ